MSPTSDFVTCSYSCAKCKATGTMKVYRYPDERDDQTAERQAKQTRWSCVEGCAFTALAAKTVGA